MDAGNSTLPLSWAVRALVLLLQQRQQQTQQPWQPKRPSLFTMRRPTREFARRAGRCAVAGRCALLTRHRYAMRAGRSNARTSPRSARFSRPALQQARAAQQQQPLAAAVTYRSRNAHLSAQLWPCALAVAMAHAKAVDAVGPLLADLSLPCLLALLAHAADIKKLKEAGIHTIKGVVMLTKKVSCRTGPFAAAACISSERQAKAIRCRLPTAVPAGECSSRLSQIGPC